MAEISVTRMLEKLQEGDRLAFDDLLASVYEELKQLAQAQLFNERRDHTLNATGLVHEAYMRLCDHRSTDWKSRAHFFGAASHVMRRILVDYARSKKTKKRDGEKVSLTLAGPGEAMQEITLDGLLDLDEALEGLGKLNERWVRVVECRYFTGLTIEETAEALGVSAVTVSNDWRMARAWLQRALTP